MLEKRFIKTKHIGKYKKCKTCNYEVLNYVLQIPSMSAAEQIFQYSQGLKSLVQTETERRKPSTLQGAMIVANKTESLFSSTYSGFGLKRSYDGKNAAEEPILMQAANTSY